MKIFINKCKSKSNKFERFDEIKSLSKISHLNAIQNKILKLEVDH